MRTVCSLLLVATVSAALPEAYAQTDGWTTSLLGDESPASKPWEDGASISLKSVDGKTTALADGVLKLERVTYQMSDRGFSRLSFGPGLYLHRNTDDAKPTNDRGLMLNVGGLWVDNKPAVGGVSSWGWSVDGKAGKKLITETVNGVPTQYDKTAARLVGRLQYVYVGAINKPLDPSAPDVPVFRWFVTGSTKLYLDRLSGGGSGASGNVSGGEVGIRADVAPFGINPAAVKFADKSLGVVPTVGVFVQRQNDFSKSGSRQKGGRTLSGIKLQAAFAQLDGAGPVPGLELERSNGADLLTGRARSGVTKLSLTLKY